METLKVAIIGAGQIAELVHLKNYRQFPERVEVIAIVDIDLARAEAFAATHGVAHAYDSVATLFEEQAIDIVSVCTPNKFHYQYVMQALSAGCHVFCEKPPAIRAQDAQAMMEKAEQKKLILAYNFHHRFAEDVQIIKSAYDEQVLGDVYSIRVQALRRCGIPGWGVFTNKDLQGGGPLIDIGIHMLDTALYILGYPQVKKVTATMYTEIGNKKHSGTLGQWDPKQFEVEDAVFAFIEFVNGATMILETSFALNIKEASIMNVHLHGNKAGATVFPAEVYCDEDGKLTYRLQRQEADAERHPKSMAAFIAKCCGEDVLLADGAQGFQIQQLVETIYRAARTGMSIEL